MNYFTIRGEAQAEYEIQRSVFICSVKGIESFDEGMEFVKAVSKRYSDATHNCYAVISVSGEQKFSDDGEPQGTAGMPILQVLKKNGLNLVACVVTRYFGGIKLGAGGLVSAYTKSAVDGINASTIVEMKESEVFTVSANYSDYEPLLRILDKLGATVTDRNYGSDIKVTFSIPLGAIEVLKNKISESFNGKLKLNFIKKAYMAY